MAIIPPNKSFEFTPVEQSLLDVLEDVCVEKQADITNITATMFLPNSMDVFSGHFPGVPVFPAVLQLALVRLLVTTTVHKPVQNISVGKTKFSMMIRPEEKIKIMVDLTEDKNKYCAKFRFLNDEKKGSSGSVIYKNMD